MGHKNRREETTRKNGASQLCSDAAVLMQLSRTGPQFANARIFLVFYSGDIIIVQLCGRINCINLRGVEGKSRVFLYTSFYIRFNYHSSIL